MLFGLAANLGQPDDLVRWLIHGGLAASAVVVLCLLGGPLIREACACGARGRPSIEWLFVLGILGALGASTFATITGSGAVYYDVVAVLVTVYAAGKALGAAAKARSFDEAQRLSRVFSSAMVLRGQAEVRIPIEEVVAGDRVLVAIGGAIPVDGRVVRGVAHVQEGMLNGELLPVVKRVGDLVRAGGLTVDGFLEVEARPNRDRSHLDRVLEDLRHAQADLGESAAQRLMDRVAAWFLPAVVLVAILTGCIWTVRSGWQEGLYHSLSVVLVACPCALGLATPLALWNGLAVLASRGVSLRSVGSIEDLARIDSVWFDRTGTLTRPDPVLLDFVTPLHPYRRPEVLAWVASLESHSTHPLAASFRRFMPGEALDVVDVRLVPGIGIEGSVRDREGVQHIVRVGRVCEGKSDAEGQSWLEQLRAESGDQVVHVWVDGELSGAGAVRHCAVEGWEEVVEALRGMGCQVGVLSGALLTASSGFVAHGQVEVRDGLLPAEKRDFIQELRRLGRSVLYIGDGANDAMALRAADVGLAVAAGSDLAREFAHGEIVRLDPKLVVEAIRIGRLVRQRIWNGLVFAGFYNVVGMLLAATGYLHPILAALLMVGSSSIVTWQAIRGASRGCDYGWREVSLRRWAEVFSIAVQIPLLGHLGAFGWTSWVVAVLGLGGLAVWRGLGLGVGRIGAMSWSMLGPGSLLMLIGWWVDAGMGPVMRDGVCLCCQSHAYFELRGHIPWMWLGMIVGSLPGMWLSLPGWGRGVSRWPTALLSAIGMVVGMNMGADFVLRMAGPGYPYQFPLAWLGMTVGMFAGMGLVCGGLEALRVLRHR